MKSIYEFLFFLIRPQYWLMNKTYSKAWDTQFQQLLKDHEFEQICRYRAKLGPFTVWIENRPYAAFHFYDIDGSVIEVRPSRMSIFKGIKKLEKQLPFKEQGVRSAIDRNLKNTVS